MIRTHTIEPLISAKAISARVEELAQTLASRLPQDVMIVSLLRGSFVFTADLIRAMSLAGSHPQVDFMTLSSYGTRITSSGDIQINRDLVEPVKDRAVLIVDDILESGRTLTFARDLVLERGAKSVTICVLLEKPGKRKVSIDADYVGFTIEDKFVVGYGLDYANHYRELPFIGMVQE